LSSNAPERIIAYLAGPPGGTHTQTRREYAEMIRQQMINRGQQIINRGQQMINGDANQPPAGQTGGYNYFSRVLVLVRRPVLAIAPAVEPYLSAGSVFTTQWHSDAIVLPGGSSRRKRNLLSVIRWLLRLHLALFYLGPADSTSGNRVVAWLLRLRNTHHISSRLVGGGLMQDMAAGEERRRVSVVSVRGDIVVSRSSGVVRVPPPVQEVAAPLRMMAVMTVVECAIVLAKEAVKYTVHKCADSRSSSRRRGGGGWEVDAIVPGRAEGEGEEEEEGGEGKTCVVCMSRRVCPTYLKCGHVFCWECILKWVERKGYCPTCRVKAGVRDVNVLEGYD